MRRRINHRQLEAFQTVMDAGSVTSAAERLLITQPAVTRLIQDLEHAVGFALFKRARGRLHPTVEAQILYDEVERSFIGLEKVMRTAEDIRVFNVGTLRIAAMPAMALSFLPRIIGAFSNDYPKVNISLQIRSSTKVMEWIAGQQFDLGFAAVQQVHPAVVQDLLLEAPFVAVLPQGHRLARKAVLGPADFEGESFISLGPEIGARPRIDAAFEDAGVVRRTVIDSQLTAAICRMVADGSGLSLVDPIAASEFCDQGIVVRPFEPILTYRYSVLYPAHRPRSRLTENFVAFVRRTIAENALLSSLTQPP